MSTEDIVVGFKTTEGNSLKKVFEMFKGIIVEGNIVFTKSGLEIRSLSSDMVAFVNLKIDGSAVDYYQCTRDVVVGLNFDELSNCFSMVSEKYSIGIEISEHSLNNNEIKVNIINNQIGLKCTRKLRMMIIDEQMMQPTEVDFASCISIDSTMFMQIVRNFKFADTIRFMCDSADFGTNLYIHTQDSDKQEAFICVNLSKDSMKITCPKNDIFKMTYIEKLAKGSTVSNSVKLYLKENYPLVLAYDIGTIGHIIFLIAPIIIDSEEDTLSTMDELTQEFCSHLVDDDNEYSAHASIEIDLEDPIIA